MASTHNHISYDKSNSHTTKHTHLSFLKTFQDILPNFVNKSNAKPKVTVVFVALPLLIMLSHTLRMERVGMLHLPWRAHTITFIMTRVTHTHYETYPPFSFENIPRHTAL